MLSSSSVGSDLCMGCRGSPSEEGQGVMKAAEQPWGDGGMHWRDGGWEKVGSFWPVLATCFHISPILVCIYICILVYECYLWAGTIRQCRCLDFLGGLWLKGWPRQPRKIFLCLAGWGQCFGSLQWWLCQLCGCLSLYFSKVCLRDTSHQQPLTSVFAPPGETWPE